MLLHNGPVRPDGALGALSASLLPVGMPMVEIRLVEGGRLTSEVEMAAFMFKS